MLAGRRRRHAVGLSLTVPALVALVISYLVPTLRTVRDSRGHNPVAEGFGFALSLAVLPLVAIVVVAPLLAYAAYRGGRPARWLVRLALVVPMACFAPTALATAWQLGRGQRPGDAEEAAWVVRLATWSTTFGLVCGVGVTASLAALRSRERGRPSWPAVLTVGALGAIAVVAASLQAYAYPALLSGGRTVTPVVAELSLTAGPAAAEATMLLGVLAVLGLLATVLVILTGLRVELDPVSRWADEPVGWRARGPATGACLGAAGLLAITGYGLWPWLTRLGGSAPPPGVSSASVLANTWLPPLVSTVVGVGVALLAGYGIGALRPLGRFSGLLLLPFAPWLFVGSGPLALAATDRNTFAALIPPGWVAIPALLIFTVFFRSSPSWQAALPMVGLVGGATLLIRAQDLCWSTVVSSDAEHMTGPLLAVRQVAELPADRVSVGLVYPGLLVVIFAVALGAVHLFYLDRITLRVSFLRWVRDPERARHPVRLR